MGKCSVVPMGGASIQCGTYDGDGTAERIIGLGRKPSLVAVLVSRGFVDGSNRLCGGLAMPGTPAKSDTGKPQVEICDTGFKVFYSNLTSDKQFSNTLGDAYSYVARFDA